MKLLDVAEIGLLKVHTRISTRQAQIGITRFIEDFGNILRQYSHI